ncbi:unnamed protein product [Cylicocyclus nassatus]|uniref:Peptidase A1 domain-containing protein n=1 Tax=Cylicocyclus nassatus TaxID=53992 RepID=A0AA36H127_CYLNA|nr:unnamed protein product [Cylicocyclus nassatus]
MMGTSTALAVLIFTTCKVVYLTSTWSDFMHDSDGIDNALSISVPLETTGDGYKHKISIGSNNQNFDVMVTLSSSMLWVPRIGCTGVGSRKQFNSTQSTSFTRDGRPWKQKSNGGTINGELGNDVATIRGSASQQLKPRCTFGMATSISGDIKMTVDGVLGLAPSNDSSNPTPIKPFISQLIETKGLLNSPMFTIFLSQQSGSNAGSVTYGSRNAITARQRHRLCYPSQTPTNLR